MTRAQSEGGDGTIPNAEESTQADTLGLSERERNLMDMIEAGALPGDFVSLGPPEQPFAARCEPAHEPSPKGALLVVPPYGEFIGKDEMTDAYLGEFPVNGWSALAVQPPLLSRLAERGDYDALADKTVARILHAIEFLKREGAERIVIVANAEGAVLARRVLVDSRPAGVSAFATVGRWVGAVDDIGVPVFELVAERDSSALELSKGRKTETERIESQPYELVMVAAADPTYTGFEREIAKRVRGWADRVVALD